MSAPTLPGSTPELLRLGSVVCIGERIGVVSLLPANRPEHCFVGGETLYGEHRLSALALLLTDGTSRWHAAHWIVAETARLASHPALTAAEVELVEQIAWGEDIDAEGIEELRGMALRLVTS